jgi:hypothetical protein
MRGIDRVLAAILLLAAIGGAAVFARESGSGLAGAVHLAAPPDQHLAAPGSVLVAPTASADHSQRELRPAGPSTLAAAFPQAAGGTATPARPATLPPARTRPRTVPQAPAAPGPTPAPTPSPAPAPAPTPAPTPAATPTETVDPVAAPSREPASAQPVPVPVPAPTAPEAPPAPDTPIKATPLPPVTVTSENVHGLTPTPQPPVDSAPSGGNDATEPLQDVRVKNLPHPTGN